jgi:hypothetical protein
MDTLGLQQLEHLEKELEQAKQKVKKFLQFCQHGIDQSARDENVLNSAQIGFACLY